MPLPSQVGFFNTPTTSLKWYETSPAMSDQERILNHQMMRLQSWSCAILIQHDRI